jgi:hypothetical protein
MTKKNNLLTLLLGILISSSVYAHESGFRILLTARMNGAQPVPSISTNAIGLASFYLNNSRDTMCLNFNSTGISGPITGIHIHNGLPGTNGSVLLDLSPYVDGNSLSATLTGSMLSPNLLNALLNGKTYLNLHTANNPNGEIRGQIVQESDMIIRANLDGMQQVPMVNTNASGVATFTLSKHLGKMKIKVVCDGLSGSISSIHLHKGGLGVNGGVVEDLSSFIVGNTVVAEVNPTAYASDLLAGNIYINLHTANNPNGEIRGQLMQDLGFNFDAWLDGAQQNPMVSTPAKGIMALNINASFDTISYIVQYTNLKSPATSVHLHLADLGGNGGVAVDLSSSINGNKLMGKITGSVINSTLINNLFNGFVYLNVHTDSNANGEIRGQLYPVLRKPYIMEMDGSKEVPMVNTMAKGLGILTIDRLKSDAHIMVVVDGLNSNGIHLHQSVEGSNGGVIYDLSPIFSNNGIFTYWKNTDAMSPFTSSIAKAIAADSIYINAHTTGNPNGEIRSQISDESYCYLNSTGIDMNESKSFINIYPNPSTSNLIVENFSGKNTQVKIYNNIGVLLFDSNVANMQNIDISSWSNGIYLIECSNEDGIHFEKLIKN